MADLNSQITKDRANIRIAVGVLLIFLSFVMYFNMWYIARGLTYIFSYSFGIMSYVIYIAMDVIGIMLIFFHDKMHIHYKSRVVAPILIFIGLCMLITCSYVSGDEMETITISNFMTHFTGREVAYFSKGFLNLFSTRYVFAGGFFGYLFVGLFSLVGSYIISIILIAIGIALYFLPNIMRALRGTAKLEKEAKKKPTVVEVTPEPVVEEVVVDPSPTPSTTNSVFLENDESKLKVAHFKRGEVNISETSDIAKARAPFAHKEETVTETYQQTYIPQPVVASEPLLAPIPRINDEEEISEREESVFIDYDDIDELSEEVVDEPAQVIEGEVSEITTPVIEETIVETRSVSPIGTSPFTAPILNPIEEEKSEETTSEPNEEEAGEPDESNPFKKASTRVNWIPPSVDLLKTYAGGYEDPINKEYADQKVEEIDECFHEFNIDVHVESYVMGPTFTRYNIAYGPKVTVDSVNKRMDELSIRLGGVTPRFEKTIQGTRNSGIELANPKIITVGFKDMFMNLPPVKDHPLAVPFGVNVVGEPVWSDFNKFPHALVAGTTGSGKTVYVQSIVTTLIMRNSPDDLKLIIIDPKMVDMTRFSNIPHLLCPIISDPSQAKICFDKLIEEMERRYRLFAGAGVGGNIESYNRYCREHGYETVPYICLFVDEFADLVSQQKEVSGLVVRIAQKSRAAGIHLLIGTQRPSVDVISGTLKGNLPTHIALRCASPTDSMVILGEGGANTLLGRGDMLVQCSELNMGAITRLQGCYLEDDEMDRVVSYLRSNYPTNYSPVFLDLVDHSKDEAANAIKEGAYGDSDNEEDEKYNTIKDWVMGLDAVSMSKIQREWSIGFNRAGRIFKRLQEEGIVSTTNDGAKGSKVLIHDNYFNNDEIASSDEALG